MVYSQGTLTGENLVISFSDQVDQKAFQKVNKFALHKTFSKGIIE